MTRAVAPAQVPGPRDRSVLHRGTDADASPAAKQVWNSGREGKGIHSLVGRTHTARGFSRHPSGNATLPLPWRRKTRMTESSRLYFRMYSLELWIHIDEGLQVQIKGRAESIAVGSLVGWGWLKTVSSLGEYVNVSTQLSHG